MNNKQKQFKKDYNTEREDVTVHVVGSVGKDNKYHLVAYPVIKGISCNDNCKYGTAYSVEEANQIGYELTTDFEKELNIKNNSILKKKQKEQETTEYGKIYIDAFRKINNPELFVAEGWECSTARDRLKYFERNILPYLANLKNEEDYQSLEVFNIISKKLENNKKTRKGNIKSDSDEHLRLAQIIYNKMRQHPYAYLPNHFFYDLSSKVTKRVVEEKLKSVPYNVIVNFRKLVEELLDDNPLLAKVIAVMESAGPRTAEAAANNKTQDYGDYVLCRIMFQYEKGKLSERLKTQNAYRVVVLDEWGEYIVRRADAIMKNRGIDSSKPIDASKVSDFIKTALIKSGLDKKTIKAWQEEMLLSREDEEMDVSAYILRRLRLTIWEHICGYTKEEIDEQSGHVKTPEVLQNSNMKEMDYYANLKKKLLRYDIMPEISNNPAHKPIEINGEMSEELMAYRKVRIKNTSSKPKRLTLISRTNEPGDSIFFTSENSNFKVSEYYIPNKELKRNNSVLLGKIEDMKYAYNKGGDDEGH